MNHAPGRNERAKPHLGFSAPSIILDHVDQGVLVLGADNEITFANKAAAGILGCASVDDLVSASLEDIAQQLALVDDQGRPISLIRLLENIEAGAPELAPLLVGLRAGLGSAYRWFRIRVRPVSGAPESDASLVMVWEDVTERRKASEPMRLLAAIVATSDDAIISKTLDGTVTSWNRAAERLYGWSSEEMVGQSIARIVPPDKLEELAGILARLANGERISHHETVRIAKDGRRIDVSVSISPILDSDGHVVGAAKIARDIRQRREAERFADAFLADLAHDVNNPLAAAKVQTQILRRRLNRKTIDAEQANASIAVIEASIAKVARRVHELSDISRLRLDGELELKLVPIEIGEVIRGVVRSSRQQERIRVLPASLPLGGNWDAERMERVFDNLIANALKYSSSETEVIVEWRRDQNAGGSWVRVTVTDSGVGIPEADLPFIFDRFRRGSNVVGRFVGTGIGLAGTKQVIELHGGEISIESRIGAGTTVTVRLPLALPKPQSAE